MAITTFPAYVDLIDDGHDLKPVPNVRRTDFESGAARQAPILSRQMVRRAVTYRACSAEVHAQFLTYLHEQLHSASDFFNWEDPMRTKAGLTPTRVRARIFGGVVESTPIDASFQMWDTKFVIEYISAQGF